MFYVASKPASQSAADLARLVQQKLTAGEVCLQCVECAQIVEGKRHLRFAAVVEQKDEYGVLLFRFLRVPCLQPSDLEIETVVVVDGGMQCRAEAPTKQENKPQPDLLVQFKTSSSTITLEMSQGEATQMFLAEVKRAQDLHSMNSAFGSPSTFAWLDKYRPHHPSSTPPPSSSSQQQPNPSSATTAPTSVIPPPIIPPRPHRQNNAQNNAQSTQKPARPAPLPPAASGPNFSNPFAEDVFDPKKHVNTNDLGTVVPVTDKPLAHPNIYVPNNTANPFAEDVFDPMKHMNIHESGKTVVATDVASSTQSTWYQDDLAAMTLSDSPKMRRQHRSKSRESLDNILAGSDDMTDSQDSMMAIQSQLGLGSGSETTVGAKPVSSREKFVKQFLNSREDEFTDLRTFKIFCGTWNVNDKLPNEALHKWLVVDNEAPDIYCVGFQELDLSKEAFIFTDSSKETEWQKAVRSYLHPKATYRKVKSVRLVGVLLIVYIQEKHIPHVKFIDSDYVATGIMGFMGNKGGVSVRFNLHSTSLCFVNSHLAAHQEQFERRNQDYRDIESKTQFKQFDPPLEVSEHDVVFWIGDLNYRIDLPIDEVKAYIRQGMYRKLLEQDQLLKEMQYNKDVFKGYEEGLPLFDPTYRYDSGTDNYDSSEKKRIPAWCDRILWRGPYVEQLRYDNHPQLRVSDHKPVSSMFNVGVRVIDQSRYKMVYEDIMKKLDKVENDYLPQIKLDKTELIFKDVRFIEGQSDMVAIANIGQAPVEFEFINKLDDPSYCRPWLKATPSKSIILPGACCEVVVEVYVDKESAASLNNGTEKFEDILVLHLAGGKDSFIIVSGNYHMSTFGSSIEAMVQMHGPIREVPTDNLIEIEQPGSLSKVDIAQDGGRIYMVPKEVWKLVDFMHRNALAKEELFQQPGLNAEIQQIRNILDTGKPADIPETISVHSVAEAFLLFLECLAVPVIPCGVYSEALAGSNNLMLSKQLISRLPDCHKNVFLYVCAFLRELLRYGHCNGLDIKFLASLFSEVLLRRPSGPSSPSQHTKQPHQKERKSKQREEESRRAAFMYHFLNADVDA